MFGATVSLILSGDNVRVRFGPKRTGPGYPSGKRERKNTKENALKKLYNWGSYWREKKTEWTPLIGKIDSRIGIFLPAGSNPHILFSGTRSSSKGQFFCQGFPTVAQFFILISGISQRPFFFFSYPKFCSVSSCFYHEFHNCNWSNYIYFCRVVITTYL